MKIKIEGMEYEELHEFCGNCGFEKVVNARYPLLCEACSEFELTFKRTRRHDPKHEINPLAHRHPITMEEMG